MTSNSPSSKKVAEDLNVSSEDEGILTQKLSQQSKKKRRKRQLLDMPKSSLQKKKPTHQSVARLRTFIDEAISSPDQSFTDMEMDSVRTFKRHPKRLSQLPCSQQSQSTASRFHHPYSLVSSSVVGSQQLSQQLSQGFSSQQNPILQVVEKQALSQGAASRAEQSESHITPKSPKMLKPTRSQGSTSVTLTTSPVSKSASNRLSPNGNPKSDKIPNQPRSPAKNPDVRTSLKRPSKSAKHDSTSKSEYQETPTTSTTRKRRRIQCKTPELPVSRQLGTSKNADKDSFVVIPEDERPSKKSRRLDHENVSTAKPNVPKEKKKTPAEANFDKLRKSLRKTTPDNTPLRSKKKAEVKAKADKRKGRMNINNPAPASPDNQKDSRPKSKKSTNKRVSKSRVSIACKGLKCGPPPCCSGCPRWQGDCKNWLNSRLVSKKLLRDECNAAGIKLTSSQFKNTLKNANSFLEKMFDELSDNTSLAYGVFSFQDFTNACKKNGVFKDKNLTDKSIAEQIKKFIGSDEKTQKQAEGIIYPSLASKTFDTAASFEPF